MPYGARVLPENLNSRDFIDLLTKRHFKRPHTEQTGTACSVGNDTTERLHAAGQKGHSLFCLLLAAVGRMH
jgi:hypothetical protein